MIDILNGSLLWDILQFAWLLQAAGVGYHAAGRGRSGHKWFGLTLLGGPLAVLYYRRQPVPAGADVSSGSFRRHAEYTAIVAVGWVVAGPVVGGVLRASLVSNYGIEYTEQISRGEALSDHVFFGAWLTVAAVAILLPSVLRYDETMPAAERWVVVVVGVAVTAIVCLQAPEMYRLARTLPQTILAVAYPVVAATAAGWALYGAVTRTDGLRPSVRIGG